METLKERIDRIHEMFLRTALHLDNANDNITETYAILARIEGKYDRMYRTGKNRNYQPQRAN